MHIDKNAQEYWFTGTTSGTSAAWWDGEMSGSNEVLFGSSLGGGSSVESASTGITTVLLTDFGWTYLDGGLYVGFSDGNMYLEVKEDESSYDQCGRRFENRMIWAM